ncbi:hypothetical protein GWI33_006160 [Rhynchophorus ferrugineus]|uniref:FAST kinase domain-containing protein 5 n=1 Tax=Rhynchophorus ferrugineus TaxID=354439 RepID=A0A834J2H2_RHYFE|nr:hypothetical protein GWI33_006160 [Rhynchophorus ferrugineus]
MYNNIISQILPQITIDKIIVNQEDFNEILNRPWRTSSATEIVNAFKNVLEYCQKNNITVSDVRFDSLVDGLMDHCEKLTDNELIELLSCLVEYPDCSSYKEHNFHDIWSCLDDICCWKLPTWSIERIFTVANLWYQLHLNKYCDFIYISLDRLIKKSSELTKDQLVHIFFLYNVCRLNSINFEYEYALENKVKEMNVDELGVIALGYFKSKTKIKLPSICEAMIKEVSFNSKYVNEITLAAIMKALRFTHSSKLLPGIRDMMDNLYPEIDRFSTFCCLQIALLLSVYGYLHEGIIDKISYKLLCVMDQLRLKDIERILHVLSTFNYVPKLDQDFVDLAYKEIHKPSRMSEIDDYPRCLPCALNYLSLLGRYSYTYMDKLLDTDYITRMFGKAARYVPREILSLDSCIEIECADYKGKRLAPHLKYKCVKWHTEYAPTELQFKKTAANELFMDVLEAIKAIVKNEENIFIHHILPHFSKASIVICKDVKTDTFVKPMGFQKYILGDVMVPFNDTSLMWFAVMLVNWNNTLRNTNLPLGFALMQERHLKKIGYKPVQVIGNEFIKLSPEGKQRYLSAKLK